MRPAAVLLILLMSSTAFATDFDGSWSGQGWFDDSTLEAPLPGDVYLSIKFSLTSLELSECWILKPNTPKRCIQSQYEIREDGELWSRGRKIGDAYPYDIQILEANSQVAEQMTFTLTAPDRVRFQYSYVNMDGQNMHRKGVLKRDP